MRQSLIVLLSCLFLINSSYGQNASERPVRFGFGMNADIEFLDQDLANDQKIAATGLSYVDLHLRINAMKYINIDGGITISHFKDKMSLAEAVTFTGGTLSGLPSEAGPVVSAMGFYYSLGALIPIHPKLGIVAAAGNRHFTAKRKVSNCNDCEKTELDINAGFYLQGGIALLPLSEDTLSGQVRFLFTHYFEEAFKYSIGVGFTFVH